MALKRNKWYSELRKNAIIEKKTNDHIKHVKITDKETDKIRYERWIVQYNKGLLTTKMTYDNEQEAIEYNEKCKNYLKEQYLQNALEKSKVRKPILEYPENLLYLLGIENTAQNYYEKMIPNFTENYEKASEYLTPREKDIIAYRLKENKTFDEIGKIIGCTRERIRQIEKRALHKLKGRVRFLTNEVADYELVKEQEYKKLKEQMSYEVALQIVSEHKEQERKKLIINAPLSVRAKNCLLRYNIVFVDELKTIDYDDLIKMRNLGKKTYKEIIDFCEKLREQC